MKTNKCIGCGEILPEGELHYPQDCLFYEVKVLKKMFITLAHAVGPYIPKGSDLEKQVYKWSKEI